MLSMIDGIRYINLQKNYDNNQYKGIEIHKNYLMVRNNLVRYMIDIVYLMVHCMYYKNISRPYKLLVDYFQKNLVFINYFDNNYPIGGQYERQVFPSIYKKFGVKQLVQLLAFYPSHVPQEI